MNSAGRDCTGIINLTVALPDFLGEVIRKTTTNSGYLASGSIFLPRTSRKGVRTTGQRSSFTNSKVCTADDREKVETETRRLPASLCTEDTICPLFCITVYCFQKIKPHGGGNEENYDLRNFVVSTYIAGGSYSRENRIVVEGRASVDLGELAKDMARLGALRILTKFGTRGSQKR